MKKISTLTGILIILAALIILSGGVFVWQEYNNSQEVGNNQVNSEIADWNTYSNEEYGFSLKYPSGYAISDKLEKAVYYNYQGSKVVEAYALKKNYIERSTLEIIAGNSSYDLSQCLQNPNFEVQKETREVLVNGVNFYVVGERMPDSAMGGARAVLSDYHTIRNNYCYIVRLSVYYRLVGYAGMINNGVTDATPEEIQAQNNEIQMNVELLDKIFSTIKFTK